MRLAFKFNGQSMTAAQERVWRQFEVLALALDELDERELSEIEFMPIHEFADAQ